jgi:hypothetical protein
VRITTTIDSLTERFIYRIFHTLAPKRRIASETVEEQIRRHRPASRPARIPMRAARLEWNMQRSGRMRRSRDSLRKLPGWLVICFLFFATSVPAAIVVQIGQNFTGSTLGIDVDGTPADSDGAAGPIHFVELINGRFSVYAKSNGSRVQTKTDLTFWKNAGLSFSPSLLVTDPRIAFDTYSQRWFASMIDFDPNNVVSNRFLLAVSTGADPTGSWRGIAFVADPVNGDFADFPTLGVDATGVYLGGDMFDNTGNSTGSALISIPKDALLANPPSAAGRTSFGILDYNARGDILQPAITAGNASTPETVLAVGDVGLDFQPHNTLVASVVSNAATTGGATLGPPMVLTVPSYSVPINPPQPDGTSNLDDGDARLSACVRRVGDILYAVHAVQVNDRAAVRWYKINALDNSLLQAGTLSDAKLHFFFPSIAANEAGTVVIACNGASSNVFVSCYAAVGETVNGTLTFGNPILLQAGAASYQLPDPSSGISRWGDYSATTLDPSDTNRFWIIQMYPSGAASWATRITELITSPVELTIAASGANVQISWPAAATSFRLQHASSLGPPDWSPVTQTPTIGNNRATVLLPASGTEAFFRLAGQ